MGRDLECEGVDEWERTQDGQGDTGALPHVAEVGRNQRGLRRHHPGLQLVSQRIAWRELLENHGGQRRQRVDDEVDEGDVPHEPQVRHRRRVAEPQGFRPGHRAPQRRLRLRRGSIGHHLDRRPLSAYISTS